MVSFQPDGKLFDGRGVTPHAVVPSIASDLVEGGTDSVLDAAVKKLRE
jgi:hypothetical protein